VRKLIIYWRYFKLENKYIEPLKKLDYANLDDIQETRLRELEKKFNDEFGTKCYFMAMEKD
jgi:hypothetical protein